MREISLLLSVYEARGMSRKTTLRLMITFLLFSCRVVFVRKGQFENAQLSA